MSHNPCSDNPPSRPHSYLLTNISRLTTTILYHPQPDSTPPPPPSVSSLSYSAQLCAASRALESELPPSARLIYDSYAASLAGVEALAHVRAARARKLQEGRSVQPRIPIRTRYFDDWIMRQLDRFRPNSVQFVSLAAGLESRAFRLEMSKTVSVFEIDVAEVLERKERIMNEVAGGRVKAGSRSVVFADLSCRGWEEGLERAGFDRGIGAVWVVEGLMYYLEEEKVEELLKEIWDMSARGSTVLFSAVSHLSERRNKENGNKHLIRSLSSMFKSCMERPRDVMEKVGWGDIRVDPLGGENANYGRWPVSAAMETIYVSGKKR